MGESLVFERRMKRRKLEVERGVSVLTRSLLGDDTNEARATLTSKEDA